MGSFQQIILGLICLGAAFGLGHYLNHYPAPENINNAVADRAAVGQPESATSFLEPGKTIAPAQPQATIATMRNQAGGSALVMNFPPRRLNDDLSVDLSGRSSIQPLPPPSQLDSDDRRPLDRGSEGNLPMNEAARGPSLPLATVSGVSDDFSAAITPPARMPNLLDSDRRREIVVPDFSQLAAGFQNTPLALPPLTAQTPPAPQLRNDLPGERERASTPMSPIDRRTSNQLVQTIPTDYLNENFAPRLLERNDADDVRFSHPSTIVPIQEPIQESANLNGMSERRSAAQQLTSNEPIASDNAMPEPAESLDMFDQAWRNRRDPSNAQDQNSSNMPPAKSFASQPIETKVEGWRAPQSVLQSTSPFTDRADGDRAHTQPISREADYRAAKAAMPFKSNENSNERTTDSTQSDLVRLRKPEQRQIKLDPARYDEYQTRAGDTLQELSSKYYGRPDFYLDIYLANQAQLRNPVDLPAGITLKIPVYE